MNNDFDNSERLSPWPNPSTMKRLLFRDEKWVGIFSVNPDSMTLLLQTLFQKFKAVDYFNSLSDTQQFFEFLKKLIESKPQDHQALKEINNIHSDIFNKISLKKRLMAIRSLFSARFFSIARSMFVILILLIFLLALSRLSFI